MNIHETALKATTSSNQSDLPECDRLPDTNIQAVPVAAPSDKLTQRSHPTTELKNTFTAASEQGTGKALPQKRSDLNAEPAEVKQYTISYRQPTITRLNMKVQNISTNNANINKEVRFETTRQQQPLESSPSLVCRLVDVCNRISKAFPTVVAGGAFVTYYFIYDVHTIDSMFRWVTTCGVATAIFVFVPLLLACSSLFVFSAFGRPCTVWEGSRKFEEEHKSRLSRSKGVSMEAVNRAKHLQMYRIVDDNKDGFLKRVLTCGFWILYLVALLILVLRQRSSTDIYAVQNIKRLFNDGLNPDDSINFKQISNFSSFWLWSEETLLPSLVSCSLGKMTTEEAESLFQLVTTPRIRQFRVDRSIADRRQAAVSQLLVISTSDRGPPGTGTGVPLLQSGGNRGYHDDRVPGSLPCRRVCGRNTPEPGTSLYILTNLRDRLWLDWNTRAILVEFALFNPYIELTCVVQLLLESSPTGYLMPAMEVRCFHVREDSTLWGMAYQCLDGLVIFTAVCLLFQELASLHLMGRSYYGDLGCWTNLLTCLASSGAAAAIVIQHLASQSSLATPDFASLSEMSVATSWYISAISLALFMVTTKQIALLNLRTYLYLLSSTVKQTTSSIISASPFFVAFVLSATWTGWMLFSGDLHVFHTHYDALMTLLNARLGHLKGTQVSQEYRLHFFFLINVTLCGFFGLFAFSVTAMKSYSLLRVRHALVTS
nr:polycystic kidney disease 2 protein 3 [Apostichopus japonicus]